ncbi:MAG: nucleotide exchange factor GrpE [Chitinophagaceae bacterium]
MSSNTHNEQEELNKKAEENAQEDVRAEDQAEHNEAFVPEESLEHNETGEIEKLNAALAEQKDKYIRLLAEFDNYKRRTAKENMEIRQTAGKDIVTSLLEVLDDVDRAETQLEKTDDINQIKEGIDLIFSKLRKSLASKGLKEMESIHTEFDPEKHEAITQIPAPTEDLQGKVLDQVKKGYYLNDKLIRHAQVVVGQ